MGNSVKLWQAVDPSFLKAIPNPAKKGYEINIRIPECTFLGVKEQPDFALLLITFRPGKKVIELKSLKDYIGQLRNIVVSYERLINIIFDHLTEVYAPERLKVIMICNPRGGISSRLTVDSESREIQPSRP